ncbi:unnamed protein product [Caenorhabditis bovis]|uniref:Uncharacterized protein n=1 Tax=Caenorhabditis bovis TaxID=2654633 RepID=A0A8S1FB80_9PELO|nr:unnamed protein product [Caenorhabditis bovis]
MDRTPDNSQNPPLSSTVAFTPPATEPTETVVTSQSIEDQTTVTQDTEHSHHEKKSVTFSESAPTAIIYFEGSADGTPHVKSMKMTSMGVEQETSKAFTNHVEGDTYHTFKVNGVPVLNCFVTTITLSNVAVQAEDPVYEAADRKEMVENVKQQNASDMPEVKEEKTHDSVTASSSTLSSKNPTGTIQDTNEKALPTNTAKTQHQTELESTTDKIHSNLANGTEGGPIEAAGKNSEPLPTSEKAPVPSKVEDSCLATSSSKKDVKEAGLTDTNSQPKHVEPNLESEIPQKVKNIVDGIEADSTETTGSKIEPTPVLTSEKSPVSSKFEDSRPSTTNSTNDVKEDNTSQSEQSVKLITSEASILLEFENSSKSDIATLTSMDIPFVDSASDIVYEERERTEGPEQKSAPDSSELKENDNSNDKELNSLYYQTHSSSSTQHQPELEPTIPKTNGIIVNGIEVGSIETAATNRAQFPLVLADTKTQVLPTVGDSWPVTTNSEETVKEMILTSTTSQLEQSIQYEAMETAAQVLPEAQNITNNSTTETMNSNDNSYSVKVETDETPLEYVECSMNTSSEEFEQSILMASVTPNNELNVILLKDDKIGESKRADAASSTTVDVSSMESNAAEVPNSNEKIESSEAGSIEDPKTTNQIRMGDEPIVADSSEAVKPDVAEPVVSAPSALERITDTSIIDNLSNTPEPAPPVAEGNGINLPNIGPIIMGATIGFFIAMKLR